MLEGEEGGKEIHGLKKKVAIKDKRFGVKERGGE